MKEVKLKRLELVNFKGIKKLEVPFEQITEIRGANATGKSTIMDAFHWILFGKDAEGNSDAKFGIKTNDSNGLPIPKLDHSVTAVLEINGESVELRRVLSEDWVTPRGKAEPELKGNTTAYFYNGVPLKESEYKAKINAVIDEDLFRMLTNPLYFPRLDWKVQREMLLKIAGGVTLEETAAQREEFSELLLQLSGKSLAEFKAEITARKKKITEELSVIPVRIDEIVRATPEALDYAALEAEKEKLCRSLKEAEAALNDQTEAQRQEYAAVQEMQRKMNELRGKQQTVLFEARQAAQKAFYEKNAARNEAEMKRHSLQTELNNLTESVQRDIEFSKASFRKNLLQIGELKRKVETLRNQWYAENAKEYSESGRCPACGQLLPEEERAEKRSLFEEFKNRELERINKEGRELNDKIQAFEKDNQRIKQYEEEETKKLAQIKEEKNSEIDRLNKLLNDLPSVLPSAEIQGGDLPEWNELQNQIDELSERLKNRPEQPDHTELSAQKLALAERLDGIKEKIALKNVIDSHAVRKSELLRREKELAQQKADLEKQEFKADRLVKEQMNEVERRVNQLFRIVRVKMFSQQINGGEKADCILLAPDGVRFMDANSAEKIEMGLDIIRALCRFHGATAPIFCDNAESKNQFPTMESQMIFLRVTEDKELTINTYENEYRKSVSGQTATL
ncbi:MAG: AAA family ATPase [Candidatus Azobacteroides sp.]|nr:AAA family ATPase [Candidatus Azobacteroides sp.]